VTNKRPRLTSMEQAQADTADRLVKFVLSKTVTGDPMDVLDAVKAIEALQEYPVVLGSALLAIGIEAGRMARKRR
jgi:hypothetical protein